MDTSDLTGRIPHLQRYARELTGNSDLADDLVHDTLELALSRMKPLQSGTNIRAWLATTLHNVLANQMRKASVRAVHVSFDDYRVSGGEILALTDEARLLKVRDLDYASQHLPARQREVVLLVELEEVSYADVAFAQDIPLGTVMSRLSRDRGRLTALTTGARTRANPNVVR